jgi:plastocyanin
MRFDRYSLMVLAATCCVTAACGDDDTVVFTQDSGPTQDAGKKHDAGLKHDAGADASAENDGGTASGGLTTSARKVSITAVEFKYTPNRITAKRSEALLITLMNRGTVPHNLRFVLPSGNKQLKNNVNPGSTGVLTLIAPAAAGSYDYYCPIDNHRALGMTGKLVVQ